MDESARQLELVRLTCRNGLRDCIAWGSDELVLRVVKDTELAGISVSVITDHLISWVSRGGEVRPAQASGANSKVPYDHLFDMVIPVQGIPQGLYLKVALCDDDSELPEIMIVSCHAATFRRGSL